MAENYNPYEEDLDIIYEDDDVKLIDVMTKKGLKYLVPDFDTQDLTDVSTEFGVFSEDIYFIVGKDPDKSRCRGDSSIDITLLAKLNPNTDPSLPGNTLL